MTITTNTTYAERLNGMSIAELNDELDSAVTFISEHHMGESPWWNAEPCESCAAASRACNEIEAIIESREAEAPTREDVNSMFGGFGNEVRYE